MLTFVAAQYERAPPSASVVGESWAREGEEAGAAITSILEATGISIDGRVSKPHARSPEGRTAAHTGSLSQHRAHCCDRGRVNLCAGAGLCQPDAAHRTAGRAAGVAGRHPTGPHAVQRQHPRESGPVQPGVSLHALSPPPCAHSFSTCLPALPLSCPSFAGPRALPGMPACPAANPPRVLWVAGVSVLPGGVP
jgi:hypothetical protein